MRIYLTAALIATQAAVATALPLNGNREFHDNVAGHSIKTYTDDFLSGFPVHIVLDGDCDRYTDVNLNLYVYNSKGHLVAKSESPVCYDEVTFTPEKEKHFEIVVKSQGSVASMGYDIKIEAEFGEPGEQ